MGTSAPPLVQCGYANGVAGLRLQSSEYTNAAGPTSGSWSMFTFDSLATKREGDGFQMLHRCDVCNRCNDVEQTVRKLSRTLTTEEMNRWSRADIQTVSSVAIDSPSSKRQPRPALVKDQSTGNRRTSQANNGEQSDTPLQVLPRTQTCDAVADMITRCSRHSAKQAIAHCGEPPDTLLQVQPRSQTWKAATHAMMCHGRSSECSMHTIPTGLDQSLDTDAQADMKHAVQHCHHLPAMSDAHRHNQTLNTKTHTGAGSQ
ncbi:hypothetical protein V8C86DRAFT_2679939 [Haematococcus lacustris]